MLRRYLRRNEPLLALRGSGPLLKQVRRGPVALASTRLGLRVIAFLFELFIKVLIGEDTVGLYLLLLMLLLTLGGFQVEGLDIAK